MQASKKIFFGFTLVLLLAVGLRFFFIWRERNEPVKVPERQSSTYKLSEDDLVSLKHKFQSSLKDAKELNGKRIWVSAGGQMNYYPATASHVDYAHAAGLLLGADPLDVRNFIEQVASKAVFQRIPTGDKQVVMLFSKPTEPEKLYGVPVGYFEQGQYTFYLDEIFFYEDPHVLYKHWPAPVWAAVEKHEVIPDMNERQVQLSLGQVSSSGQNTPGDRTVEFNNNGHPIRVTFVHDKATTITPVN